MVAQRIITYQIYDKFTGFTQNIVLEIYSQTPLGGFEINVKVLGKFFIDS